MQKKIVNWKSCPMSAPEKLYVCSKPMGHSGLCVAEFANTNEVHSWETMDGINTPGWSVDYQCEEEYLIEEGVKNYKDLW